MYDSNGKLIFEKSVNDYEINDFSFGDDLKPGFYQLFIDNNQGVSEIFKLLKLK